MGESNMRRLATIQKIANIVPVENSDSLDCLTIQGWEVVSKRGTFKTGDLCVYFEIDSIVPDKPEFEFLRNKKFRIRTIKLRGQVSQGLAIPLDECLPENSYCENQDVTDIIGVTKYDPQHDAELKMFAEQAIRNNNKLNKFLMKFPWYRKLMFKPKKLSFPNFIRKTDETRVQNLPDVFETEKDTKFEVTCKIDGCSISLFLVKNRKRFLWFGKKYIFGVCSRNIHLVKPDNSHYWLIAKQFNIESTLKDLIGDNDYVVLQGEIIGTNIQGNKYKVNQYDLYAFNLIFSKDNKTLDTVTMSEMLMPYGIKTVPILETGFKLTTINELIKYSNGKSVLNPNVMREGIVVRNRDKNISFKVISPEFLLKIEKDEQKELDQKENHNGKI